LFSYEVMLLWTSDPATAENTYVLVTLLVIGTALHGLMYLPYALQLAYGWTNLCFYVNVIAIVLLAPMLIVMVHYYGAIGAAIVWIVLNSGYVLVDIQIMHRRLLKGEKWRWYREDVGLPLASSLATVSIGYWLLPTGMSPFMMFVYLSTVLLATFLITAMVAPQVQLLLKSYLSRRIMPFFSG